MKISIIVPVYNAESSIKNCVDSIIKQPLECELEIILVEDFSTDNSYEYCKRLQEEYEEICVLRTEGKGVSAARNTGLRYASGEIIGFCDSDDIFEKDILETIRNVFINEDVDIVIGGFYYSVFSNDVLQIEEIHSYSHKKKTSGLTVFNKILNDNRILGSVCNKFYKSTIIKNYIFRTDLDYCEDLFFNAELILSNNPKALILDFPVYHYIRNYNSATNSMERLFDSNFELKYIVALQKLKKTIRNNKCLSIVGYKIETLAIDCLFHHNIFGEKEKKLYNAIAEYNSDFKKCFFKNLALGSLKWEIKRIIVHKKRKKGREKE